MDRKNELILKEIMNQLPPLGTQDGKGGQAVVYAKFFTPDSNWVWLMLEYDPETQTGYGLVQGIETEMGYFSLAEMAKVTGPMGLPIERDMSWTPKSLAEAKAQLR